MTRYAVKKMVCLESEKYVGVGGGGKGQGEKEQKITYNQHFIIFSPVPSLFDLIKPGKKSKSCRLRSGWGGGGAQKSLLMVTFEICSSPHRYLLNPFCPERFGVYLGVVGAGMAAMMDKKYEGPMRNPSPPRPPNGRLIGCFCAQSKSFKDNVLDHL